MAHLVLTVAGTDRAGLTRSLAEVIAAHGGNWERSELTELAGVFAGVVLVDVPDTRRAEALEALAAFEDPLRVSIHDAPVAAPVPTGRRITVEIVGNDQPGIVRDVAVALESAGLSVDRLSSRVRPAPMAGGELFTASVVAHATADAAVDEAVARLEAIAAEIQVEITAVGTDAEDAASADGGGPSPR